METFAESKISKHRWIKYTRMNIIFIKEKLPASEVQKMIRKIKGTHGYPFILLSLSHKLLETTEYYEEL